MTRPARGSAARQRGDHLLPVPPAPFKPGLLSRLMVSFPGRLGQRPTLENTPYNKLTRWSVEFADRFHFCTFESLDECAIDSNCARIRQKQDPGPDGGQETPPPPPPPPHGEKTRLMFPSSQNVTYACGDDTSVEAKITHPCVPRPAPAPFHGVRPSSFPTPGQPRWPRRWWL